MIVNFIEKELDKRGKKLTEFSVGSRDSFLQPSSPIEFLSMVLYDNSR